MTPPHVDDRDLVDRARRGDSSALELIFQRYWKVALRQSRRYASSDHVAEDLAADAFARMVEAVVKGGGPWGSIGPYLGVAVRNAAISRARAKEVRLCVAASDALAGFVDERPSTEELVMDGDDMALSLLAELPPRWRGC